MEFKFGTSVYTSERDVAGILASLAISPETKAVTHIVIQEWLFANENKVIPIEMIASGAAAYITMGCTADELREMPPLEIEQEMPMDNPSSSGEKYDPLSGGVYWNPTLERSIITEVKRTIPDEFVVFEEGAQVFDNRDEQMGSVESVLTEPETGKITSFFISRGLLFKTRKSIPLHWINAITASKLTLNVSKVQIENLPEEAS